MNKPVPTPPSEFLDPESEILEQIFKNSSETVLKTSAPVKRDLDTLYETSTHVKVGLDTLHETPVKGVLDTLHETPVKGGLDTLHETPVKEDIQHETPELKQYYQVMYELGVPK